jgi:hypothetical protein
MFVTSVSQSGDMSGIHGADETCNSRARIAGLPGHYQAWLCDGVDSPASRSTQATVPYTRTDGTPIAKDWGDLIDGEIDASISFDESGHDVWAVDPFLPWTNVEYDGTCTGDTYLSPGTGPCPAATYCPKTCAADGQPGWTTSSLLAQGAKGDIHFTSSRWTHSPEATALCSVPPERIYCIEQ